jgi:hypothetical protein
MRRSDHLDNSVQIARDFTDSDDLSNRLGKLFKVSRPLEDNEAATLFTDVLVLALELDL